MDPDVLQPARARMIFHRSLTLRMYVPLIFPRITQGLSGGRGSYMASRIEH